MAGCTGSRPRDLGVAAGVLRPCPGTPNCVSSEAGTPPDRLVAPLPAPAGATDLSRLADLLAAWPRTTVVAQRPDYLHVQATSRILRFVDDVEFRYDTAAKVIQVRSASRLGRKDFGVNRDRVERIRSEWAARAK